MTLLFPPIAILSFLSLFVDSVIYYATWPYALDVAWGCWSSPSVRYSPLEVESAKCALMKYAESSILENNHISLRSSELKLSRWFPTPIAKHYIVAFKNNYNIVNMLERLANTR